MHPVQRSFFLSFPTGIHDAVSFRGRVDASSLASCHLDQNVVILIGRHHGEDRECSVIS
jgi:hypothetical protein